MKSNRLTPADFLLPREPEPLHAEMNITVSGPKNTPFMLHPALSMGPVWVLFRDNKWYLIAAEVGSSFIRGKSKADLFFGMTATGERFIQVVLHPWKGRAVTWKKSADEIVKMAQREWLQMSSNHAAERFDYHFVDLVQSPGWPRRLSEKTIIDAFAGRIITRDNVDMLSRTSGDTQGDHQHF